MLQKQSLSSSTHIDILSFPWEEWLRLFLHCTGLVRSKMWTFIFIFRGKQHNRLNLVNHYVKRGFCCIPQVGRNLCFFQRPWSSKSEKLCERSRDAEHQLQNLLLSPIWRNSLEGAVKFSKVRKYHTKKRAKISGWEGGQFLFLGTGLYSVKICAASPTV